MTPLMLENPNIDDFKCYNVNRDFFNLKKVIANLLEEATHFCYVQDYLDTYDPSSVKVGPNEFTSNWFAFKTFNNLIIYRKDPINEELKSIIKSFDEFSDFVFKYKKDYTSPLFLKNNELLFCSIHSKDLVFVKNKPCLTNQIVQEESASYLL